eukprot:9493624-Pyramimonas_sp.AAC.1
MVGEKVLKYNNAVRAHRSSVHKKGRSASCSAVQSTAHRGLRQTVAHNTQENVMTRRGEERFPNNQHHHASTRLSSEATSKNQMHQRIVRLG